EFRRVLFRSLFQIVSLFFLVLHLMLFVYHSLALPPNLNYLLSIIHRLYKIYKQYANACSYVLFVFLYEKVHFSYLSLSKMIVLSLIHGVKNYFKNVNNNSYPFNTARSLTCFRFPAKTNLFTFVPSSVAMPI